jgi:hypothetical protein
MALSQWILHWVGYVRADHLNGPAKMTEASQTVVWDAYYWSYGGAGRAREREISGPTSQP